MTKMMGTTALILTFVGGLGFAQTTDIQDVTPTENGVNIEADAGPTPVDAETQAPAMQQQQDQQRTQIDPNPITEQLETDFSETDTGSTGGSMGLGGDADRANARVAELIGLDVLDKQGETVGDVSEVVKIDEDIAVIIGVGGLLGLGERDVAVSLNDLTYEQDKLVLSNIAPSDLDEMSYDADDGETLDDDVAVMVFE